jgi:hypothetical protein
MDTAFRRLVWFKARGELRFYCALWEGGHLRRDARGHAFAIARNFARLGPQMHAAATQHAADDSVPRQQLSQLGLEELTG